MMIKADLQVHFLDSEKSIFGAAKQSRYYHEVTEIQYGANGIGAFMIITYYEGVEIKTALHYLDELDVVADKYGPQTYYRNFN